MENNINLSDLPYKDELLLDFDMFQKPAVRKDILALAQQIQNLVIIEKGTYPNQPNLGVGIANYLFELGDTFTLEKLRTEIDKQIDMFIDPKDFNIEINLQMIEGPNKRINTLSLGIVAERISLNRTHEDTVIDQDYSYAQLLIGANTTNRKIISKILV